MKFTRIALATTFALVTSASHAAQYQLELLPLDEVAVNNFAQAITNDGTVYVTAQDEFNPPIDLSLIDFENEDLLEALTDQMLPTRATTTPKTTQPWWPSYFKPVQRIVCYCNAWQNSGVLGSKAPMYS